MNNVFFVIRFRALLPCKMGRIFGILFSLALLNAILGLHPVRGDQRFARFITHNSPDKFVNLRGSIVNIILTCYEKPPRAAADLCQKTDFDALQGPLFRFIETKPPQLQGLNVIFTKTPLSRQGANIQHISSSCSYSNGRYKILYVDKGADDEHLRRCVFQSSLSFLGFIIPAPDVGNIDSQFFGSVLTYYTRTN